MQLDGILLTGHKILVLNNDVSCMRSVLFWFIYSGIWTFIVFFTAIFIGGCVTTYHYKPSTLIPKPHPAPPLENHKISAYTSAINQIRSHGRYCGKRYYPPAPSVHWNDALYRSAYEHSRDMMISDRMQHRGSHGESDWTAKKQHLSHGSSFRERIENNGYTHWRHIAENIESGSSTLSEVIKHWLSSKGHCKNMMNPAFTDFGMAHLQRKGSRYGHYWTQDFARHQ
jgi:uncharacterized protein YkwD